MLQLHQTRLDKLRAEMVKQQVDCTIIFNSPNLFYITGYAPKKCERLQIAIVPLDGEPLMVVPSLYQVAAHGQCDLADQRLWYDGDDLYAFVKGLLAEKGVLGKTLAIDDTTEFRTLDYFLSVSPGSKLVKGSNLFTPLRMFKSQEELDLMRESCRLTDESIGRLMENIYCGKSEAELKTWAEYDLAEKGMRQGFSNLIAFGPATADCHHICDDVVPKKGMAGYLDIGGAYNHYWSDVTRSFFLGKAPQKYVDCYQRVLEAQLLAMDYIKPGVLACDVDKVARDYLAKYDLAQYFVHRLGHGQGLDGHELPNLSSDCKLELQPGMTFSCEPGVYFEGEWGIRIEDTVAVTETGCEALNSFSKEYVEL